jgi:hypothetical protein
MNKITFGVGGFAVVAGRRDITCFGDFLADFFAVRLSIKNGQTFLLVFEGMIGERYVKNGVEWTDTPNIYTQILKYINKPYIIFFSLCGGITEGGSNHG